MFTVYSAIGMLFISHDIYYPFIFPQQANIAALYRFGTVCDSSDGSCFSLLRLAGVREERRKGANHRLGIENKYNKNKNKQVKTNQDAH